MLKETINQITRDLVKKREFCLVLYDTSVASPKNNVDFELMSVHIASHLLHQSKLVNVLPSLTVCYYHVTYRVNLHSIVALTSWNSLLVTGAISEV